MEGIKKAARYFVYGAFAIAELVIYVVFVSMDASGEAPVMLKYCGILLCLLVSLAGIYFYGRDGAAISLAMAFTAISDLFIFVLNDYYELGLTTFIIVQTVYFIRIYLTTKKAPYISLGIRIALVIITWLTLFFTDSFLPLTALAGAYICMLVCNAVESAFLIRISKKYILFTIGLILFIGCDVCVGLNNFSLLGITLPPSVDAFVAIAMWAFYLPSQVLIVISARRVERSLQ